MLEHHFKSATQRGAASQASEPQAIAVTYDPASRQLSVALNNWCTLMVPIDLIQGCSACSDEELTQVTLLPGGSGIYWEKADIAIGVLSLLQGRFGNRKWMTQLHQEKGIPLGLWPNIGEMMAAWGRKGGSTTSKVKSQTARQNGQKGGRPKKQPSVSNDVAIS